MLNLLPHGPVALHEPDAIRPHVQEREVLSVIGLLALADEDSPVYVAGDARNGSSLVVSAMADALACAAEVAETLGL